MVIVGTIISIVCAYLCWTMAPKCNIHPLIGAALGFFFNLIPVLIFWLLGKRR